METNLSQKFNGVWFRSVSFWHWNVTEFLAYPVHFTIVWYGGHRCVTFKLEAMSMLGWSALEATYSLLLHLLDISFTAIVYCDHAVWLLVGVTDILTTLEKCIVDSNDDIIYCNVSTQVHGTISLSLSLLWVWSLSFWCMMWPRVQLQGRLTHLPRAMWNG